MKVFLTYRDMAILRGFINTFKSFTDNHQSCIKSHDYKSSGNIKPAMAIRAYFGNIWAWQSYLVLAVEVFVGNHVRNIGVQESAKCKTIVPAAAEVGDIDALKVRNENTRLFFLSIIMVYYNHHLSQVNFI